MKYLDMVVVIGILFSGAVAGRENDATLSLIETTVLTNSSDGVVGDDGGRVVGDGSG